MVKSSVLVADQLIDRYGNAIVVIEVGTATHKRVHQRELAKVGLGAPRHVCRPVYPWQREFWGAGVHTGPHDCPDGGCSR
jgi:hypothetical protein